MSNHRYIPKLEKTESALIRGLWVVATLVVCAAIGVMLAF